MRDRSGTDERHDGKGRQNGRGDGAGGAPKKQRQEQANKGVENHHQNRGPGRRGSMRNIIDKAKNWFRGARSGKTALRMNAEKALQMKRDAGVQTHVPNHQTPHDGGVKGRRSDTATPRSANRQPTRLTSNAAITPAPETAEGRGAMVRTRVLLGFGYPGSRSTVAVVSPRLLSSQPTTGGPDTYSG